MISNRSYLLRALYEWVLDCDCTPYIVINTESKDVLVPPGYAEDNQIVLNISPSAVRNLDITQGTVYFQSRFSGTAHNVSAPVGSVVAIFAKETGEGMVFDLEGQEGQEESSEELAAKSAGIMEVVTDTPGGTAVGSRSNSRLHLRVVK